MPPCLQLTEKNSAQRVIRILTMHYAELLIIPRILYDLSSYLWIFHPPKILASLKFTWHWVVQIADAVPCPAQRLHFCATSTWIACRNWHCRVQDHRLIGCNKTFRHERVCERVMTLLHGQWHVAMSHVLIAYLQPRYPVKGLSQRGASVFLMVRKQVNALASSGELTRHRRHHRIRSNQPLLAFVLILQP